MWVQCGGSGGIHQNILKKKTTGMQTQIPVFLHNSEWETARSKKSHEEPYAHQGDVVALDLRLDEEIRSRPT